MILGLPDPVFNCVLGGAALQILNVIDGLSAAPDRRPDFKSYSYYIVILFNLVLSGLLGYVYFDDTQKLNKIVYFHVGLSAPLILRSLATTIPAIVRHNSNE